MAHPIMTIQGGNINRHLGREQGRIKGKQAYLKFLTWLFAPGTTPAVMRSKTPSPGPAGNALPDPQRA